MKRINRYLMMKPVHEIVQHFALSEENFDVRLTNYSINVEFKGFKYFFSDEPMSAQIFAFYNLINKDVGGEIRPVQQRIKYFDFKGLKQGVKIPKCYCVDINSAYLKSLEIEQVITKETFDLIDAKSRANKKAKMNRLKAVGLFARQPTIICYRNGQVEEIEIKENPFSWVFFQACKTTNIAMEAVKKMMPAEYLFYWVDGIFLLDNPQKAVDILSGYGFETKIELIENLEIIDGAAIYEKDGKNKLLFMPKSEKENNREFLSKINSAEIL